MNVARLKFLFWVVSLAVAGALGYYVYTFIQERDVLSRPVSKEEQSAVLSAVRPPEPPKEDVVAYESIRAVFHGMNWTGVEKVDEKGPEGPVKPPEPPKTPVSDLLVVLLIQFDTDAPDSSLAVVEYKDGKLKAAAKGREDYVLRPGETLAKPYDHVKVAAIEIEAVRFVFTNDEEREPELVTPLPPPKGAGIVAVGPEGAVLPPATGSNIRRPENYPQFRPLETQQIRSNEFQIGVDTARRVEEDYSRILSQDVGYKPYRNPRTREIEGLQITYVRPGSVVSDHGIGEGEILKSINGYAVKSTSDAINYVKQAASETDTWIAVFLKQGREITRTYKSPPPE